MVQRDFDEWMSKFKDTISTYSYYVDFNKVIKHADEIKVPLNIMNSLIGSKDIEDEFIKLAKEYPIILKCVPTLIAVRETEIRIYDSGHDLKFNFSNPNYPLEQYVKFMREVGLFDLISKRLIANLYDYVLGVETGLDSNARKNRGGHQMEDLVESYLRKEGLNYTKEEYISTIEKKMKMDLSRITNKGKTKKRFDFVVYSREQVYAIEVNFYASSGSKLNETARSYKTITLEAKDIPNFNFVWITDGHGWNDARNNLRETFDVLDMMYSLDDLEHGVLSQIK